MKTAILATAAVMVAMTAHGQQIGVQQILDDPGVIQAMKTAWGLSTAGLWQAEASFRLDACASGYEIVAEGFSNQAMHKTVKIIPGKTFALFHVHPSRGEGPPTEPDRKIADTYRVKMFTMHMSGLWEYDPDTGKTTRLRIGATWGKPPSQHKRGPEIARKER